MHVGSASSSGCDAVIFACFAFCEKLDTFLFHHPVSDQLKLAAKSSQGVLAERIVLPLRERVFVPCGAIAQWLETVEVLLPVSMKQPRPASAPEPPCRMLSQPHDVLEALCNQVLQLRAGRAPRVSNGKQRAGFVYQLHWQASHSEHPSVLEMLPEDLNLDDGTGLLALSLPPAPGAGPSWIWPEDQGSTNKDDLRLRAVVCRAEESGYLVYSTSRGFQGPGCWYKMNSRAHRCEEDLVSLPLLEPCPDIDEAYHSGRAAFPGDPLQGGSEGGPRNFSNMAHMLREVHLALSCVVWV
jgi:hypothetical protein